MCRRHHCFLPFSSGIIHSLTQCFSKRVVHLFERSRCTERLMATPVCIRVSEFQTELNHIAGPMLLTEEETCFAAATLAAEKLLEALRL